MNHAASRLAFALVLPVLMACQGSSSGTPAPPPSPSSAPEWPPVPTATPADEPKVSDPQPTPCAVPRPDAAPALPGPVAPLAVPAPVGPVAPLAVPALPGPVAPLDALPLSPGPPPGADPSPQSGAGSARPEPAPAGDAAPQTARILSYTNPPPAGFRWEVDPATNNSSRLVLNLQGPKQVQAYGVAFFLGVGAQAAWTQPAEGAALLLAGRDWNPGRNEPRLARAKVLGETIQVGFFRREDPACWLGATPILSLALELKPGADPGPIRLWVPGGKQAVYLDGDKVLRELTLHLGSLVAK